MYNQEWQSRFRRQLVFRGCDKRWTASQKQAHKSLWQEQDPRQLLAGMRTFYQADDLKWPVEGSLLGEQLEHQDSLRQLIRADVFEVLPSTAFDPPFDVKVRPIE